MVEFENLTNYELNLNKLETIFQSLSKKDIEFVLCDNAYIRNLNKRYRNKDTATDVLSFPLEAVENAPIGSIVISLDCAKDASKKYGHSMEDEISLLFIHGLLHLLGYDHEVDEGQMRQKEQELIQLFELPKSLIVRNS